VYHEGARQGHALLLAAREHLGVVRQALAQAHAGQHVGSGLARVAAVGQLQRQHHVLQRGEVAHELEALEHEAHLLRAQRGALVLVDGEEVMAIEPHRAARGRIEPGDDGQERALARARGPHDGRSFPWRQAEIDIPQNVQRTGRIRDRLEDVLDGNNGGHGRWGRFGHERFFALIRHLQYRRHFILSAGILGLAGVCASTAWAQAPASSAPGAPAILVLGDSLSAEYGLARGAGWVALLEKRLQEEKMVRRVVNASVSGETTSGGRSRLAALLTQHKPAVVVIELGGNDALRGLPLKNTEENLTAMTDAAQKAGAKVLLVGMQVPPNYGTDYANRFAGLFTTVAQAKKVAVVPFFLKGVADGPDPTRLFQADRIHPRAEAHPQMLANVWPELKKLLR